jgi:hypothetical protein
MSPPPIEAIASLDAARRHRVELLDTMCGVERALAVPAAEPDWLAAVAVRLTALRLAFAEHMSLTEGSDGLYAELLEHAPRLAYQVRGLAREHAVLALDIEAICARLPDGLPDELRRWAGDLLRDLSGHRQRGADLVYEAYATDIGGET